MNYKGRPMRNLYYVFVGIFIVGFVTYYFHNIFNNRDIVTLSQDIPSEYLSILNQNDTSEIKPVITYSSKYRFPITLLDYKQKYTLIIFKISDQFGIKTTDDIHIKQHYSNEKTYGTYSIVNENHFEVYYHNDSAFKFNRIEVNLSGDSITNIIQSDTLLLYYLKFNQISWTKKNNGILDIYIEPKDVSPIAKKIPASIAFIKRANSFFFVLFTVNDYSSSFDQGMLLKLLLGSH
jgi:hypothetical protein